MTGSGWGDTFVVAAVVFAAFTPAVIFALVTGAPDRSTSFPDDVEAAHVAFGAGLVVVEVAWLVMLVSGVGWIATG